MSRRTAERIQTAAVWVANALITIATVIGIIWIAESGNLGSGWIFWPFLIAGTTMKVVFEDWEILKQ